MARDKIYDAGSYKYILGCEGTLRVNVLDNLPDDRFVLALQRLRKYVEKAPFIPDDSDQTGYKHTHCSWGMCCDVKEVYPDKQDYVWPERNMELIDGHVYPLHLSEKQLCPHDMRKKKSFNGCFFTCAYRQQLESGNKRANREKALLRIDNRIKEWTGK